MREAFEIAEDDEAGLVVEVQSDFLLSGVNLAITNKETGTIMEDERRDSSGKLIIGRLVPGPYVLVLYTHECITNMDPGAGQAISSFDLALKMSVRLLRLAGHGESSALSASVPVELLDDHAEGAGHGVEHVKESSAAVPLVVTAEELGCLKEYFLFPPSLMLTAQWEQWTSARPSSSELSHITRMRSALHLERAKMHFESSLPNLIAKSLCMSNKQSEWLCSHAQLRLARHNF